MASASVTEGQPGKSMAYTQCYNIMIGDNPDLHLQLSDVYALKEICEAIIVEAERLWANR
jgi:hypothetical protein